MGGGELREQEGYYVPIGGARLDASVSNIYTSALTLQFHDKRGCDWTRIGKRIPPECVAVLENAVAAIPFWSTITGGADERGSLRLDLARLTEIAEAWAPVMTSDGPGILVWENCD